MQTSAEQNNNNSSSWR